MFWKSKWILMLFVFGLTLVAEAQVNQVDSRGRKQGTWVKNFDGKEFGHIVRYQGQFKDDKPVGKFVYYYPTKKVRAIIIHDENSPRSEAYLYHDNEQLAAHGIYRNGKKDSVWTNFLPTGHYSSTETYKNDQLNGEKTIFYGPEVTIQKTRLVLRKDNYRNGELNGEFIEYFPDGVVKAKGSYLNGVLNGKVMRYHPNGRPMFEEYWKNRRKHGLWKTFDESGKEEGRKYYKNGLAMEGKNLEKYLQDLKAQGKGPND